MVKKDNNIPSSGCNSSLHTCTYSFESLVDVETSEINWNLTHGGRIINNPWIKNVQPSPKKSIFLFVGIYSAPVRKDRRTAVRETWMAKCQSNPKVVCRFITDGQDTRGKTLQGKVRETLENESKQHGDLVLADSPGGMNFGRRYLWMAKWASERYEFKYIFRVDDDYFVCFDKLLNELEFHRPKQKFTWGWLHCSMKGKK